jgi:CubicO group peptidase (beta-lactamase class C family)
VKQMLVVFLFAASAAAQTTDDITARVDAIFSQYRDAPGCAVGVSRSGKAVLTRGYGMANLEYDIPITPASIFEAGSVSKQFTAAAVVLLAQDGKLSLEDPVRKYLPELSPITDPVTIREMLNHTSGIRDWGTITDLAGWPRGKRAHTMPIVLDILSRQRSLNFPAGTQWSYSNSNYNLAAMIVERVSGKSFPAFTSERIFTPLGMTSSGWRDDYARVVKGRAFAYDPVKGGGYRANMHYENIYGNCCLMTTVGDLLAWNEDFRTPRVGGQPFVDAMQTPGVLKHGEKIDYALGLFVANYHGKREISHGGATAGYRAFLMRLPDDDLSVALLCNRGDVNAGSLAHKVADVFLPPFKETTTPAVVAEADASLAGLYRDPLTDALLPIQVSDKKVSLGFTRSFELRPLGNGRWAIHEGNEIRFDKDGLVLTTGHKAPARYVRVDAATPSAAALEEYAGTVQQRRSWCDAASLRRRREVDGPHSAGIGRVADADLRRCFSR